MVGGDVGWMKDGACRAVDTDTFFPADGAGLGAARAVCETCPVREACLDYAIDNRINHGIWGGESERARQRIRRARRRARRPAA